MRVMDKLGSLGNSSWVGDHIGLSLLFEEVGEEWFNDGLSVLTDGIFELFELVSLVLSSEGFLLV